MESSRICLPAFSTLHTHYSFKKNYINYYFENNLLSNVDNELQSSPISIFASDHLNTLTHYDQNQIESHDIMHTQLTTGKTSTAVVTSMNKLTEQHSPRIIVDDVQIPPMNYCKPLSVPKIRIKSTDTFKDAHSSRCYNAEIIANGFENNNEETPNVIKITQPDVSAPIKTQNDYDVIANRTRSHRGDLHKTDIQKWKCGKLKTPSLFNENVNHQVITNRRSSDVFSKSISDMFPFQLRTTPEPFVAAGDDLIQLNDSNIHSYSKKNEFKNKHKHHHSRDNESAASYLKSITSLVASNLNDSNQWNIPVQQESSNSIRIKRENNTCKIIPTNSESYQTRSTEDEHHLTTESPMLNTKKLRRPSKLKYQSIIIDTPAEHPGDIHKKLKMKISLIKESANSSKILHFNNNDEFTTQTIVSSNTENNDLICSNLRADELISETEEVPVVSQECRSANEENDNDVDFFDGSEHYWVANRNTRVNLQSTLYEVQRKLPTEIHIAEGGVTEDYINDINNDLINNDDTPFSIETENEMIDETVVVDVTVEPATPEPVEVIYKSVAEDDDLLANVILENPIARKEHVVCIDNLNEVNGSEKIDLNNVIDANLAPFQSDIQGDSSMGICQSIWKVNGKSPTNYKIKCDVVQKWLNIINGKIGRKILYRNDRVTVNILKHLIKRKLLIKSYVHQYSTMIQFKQNILPKLRFVKRIDHIQEYQIPKMYTKTAVHSWLSYMYKQSENRLNAFIVASKISHSVSYSYEFKQNQRKSDKKEIKNKYLIEKYNNPKHINDMLNINVSFDFIFLLLHSRMFTFDDINGNKDELITLKIFCEVIPNFPVLREEVEIKDPSYMNGKTPFNILHMNTIFAYIPVCANISTNIILKRPDSDHSSSMSIRNQLKALLSENSAINPITRFSSYKVNNYKRTRYSSQRSTPKAKYAKSSQRCSQLSVTETPSKHKAKEKNKVIDVPNDCGDGKQRLWDAFNPYSLMDEISPRYKTLLKRSCTINDICTTDNNGNPRKHIDEHHKECDTTIEFNLNTGNTIHGYAVNNNTQENNKTNINNNDENNLNPIDVVQQNVNNSNEENHTVGPINNLNNDIEFNNNDNKNVNPVNNVNEFLEDREHHIDNIPSNAHNLNPIDITQQNVNNSNEDNNSVETTYNLNDYIKFNNIDNSNLNPVDNNNNITNNYNDFNLNPIEITQQNQNIDTNENVCYRFTCNLNDILEYNNNDDRNFHSLSDDNIHEPPSDIINENNIDNIPNNDIDANNDYYNTVENSYSNSINNDYDDVANSNSNENLSNNNIYDSNKNVDFNNIKNCIQNNSNNYEDFDNVELDHALFYISENGTMQPQKNINSIQKGRVLDFYNNTETNYLHDVEQTQLLRTIGDNAKMINIRSNNQNDISLIPSKITVHSDFFDQSDDNGDDDDDDDDYGEDLPLGFRVFITQERKEYLVTYDPR